MFFLHWHGNWNQFRLKVCLGCVIFMFFVCVCSVAWLFLLGCRYQCKWLTGKTRLWNEQKCVDGDVKRYSISISIYFVQKCNNTVIHPSPNPYWSISRWRTFEMASRYGTELSGTTTLNVRENTAISTSLVGGLYTASLRLLRMRQQRALFIHEAARCYPRRRRS